MLRVFSLFFLLALVAIGARAQTARWEQSDDPAELQLVFEGCEPEGEPRLPQLSGVTFALAGTATQTNIVNFSATRSTILSYRFRAQQSGQVQIPAFNVTTDKGQVRVQAFTTGAAAPALDSMTSGNLAPPGNSFWAGEVFPLTYTIGVSRRYYAQIGPNIDWTAAPVVAEEWSKPEPFQTANGNDQRVGFVYRTRVYTKTPGRIALNAAQQVVNLQTGSVGFGLFQQPRLEQVTVTSNRPEITIRPLPVAPPAFRGAVGQFMLSSKVVPSTATVGEPVTWTLTLTGSGNWPDVPGLPSREVSKDFQVVQPQAKRQPAEGKLFDASLAEDVVLVPSRPGTYTLAPVAFVYFDPKSGTYQTITTDKTTITIEAPVAPRPAFDSPIADKPISGAPKLSMEPPRVPPPPGVIPRDPLPGEGHTFAPFTLTPFAIALGTPFVVMLFAWLGLALQRARKTDPLLRRREARQRMVTTLAQLRSTEDPAQRSRLILAWQHDVAIFWKLTHAAPPATLFADPAWSALWLESDRALYGAPTGFPADWVTRAESALGEQRVPTFSATQLFLPRNLVPLIAVACVLSSTLALRADLASDYRAGKFAAAESTGRATVKVHPTDWVARHNLALALAQQDRWAEAAAQATAAFLQNPRDPSVRWHFSNLAEKAGFVPAPLAAFLQPGPLQYAARLASPSGWQITLVTAAFLFALAITLWLFSAYGRGTRQTNLGASFSFGLALILTVIGVPSLHAYGEAANHRAVLAWHGGVLFSIPTEADTSQKTTPLAAGSVAVIDNTYLGWVHLVFSNGQTGWIKKADIVGLWQ